MSETATSAERVARNQVIFRDANEAIHVAVADSGLSGGIPFICECADPRCTAIVRVEPHEYTRVRTDPTLFINAPGHHRHAQPHARVVADHGGYEIVAKVAEAGDVAAEYAADADPAG